MMTRVTCGMKNLSIEPHLTAPLDVYIVLNIATES